MERITKKQVEGIFQVYLHTTGRKPASRYDDVGGYYLDDNGAYGGFVVCQVLEGTAITCPFGDGRRKAREMWDCLHFALRAHEDFERTNGKAPDLLRVAKGCQGFFQYMKDQKSDFTPDPDWMVPLNNAIGNR